MSATTAQFLADPVPADNPGVREIGFAIGERYNASRVHRRGESLRRG